MRWPSCRMLRERIFGFSIDSCFQGIGLGKCSGLFGLLFFFKMLIIEVLLVASKQSMNGN